jgi:hypothetical protein
MDYYLKASTEAVLSEALVTSGLVDEEGNPAPFVHLDVIGPITKVTGYNEDGTPIIVSYPEWHVNVRCPAPVEGLDAFSITPPDVPYRVWA